MDNNFRHTTQHVIDYFETQEIEIDQEDAELLLEFLQDMVASMLDEYFGELNQKFKMSQRKLLDYKPGNNSE